MARTYQNMRLFRGLSALDNVIVGTHGARTRPFAARLAFVSQRAPRGGSDAREQARALLARVNLGGARGRAGDELPYGEQRRLEIARALAARRACCCSMSPPRG